MIVYVTAIGAMVWVAACRAAKHRSLATSIAFFGSLWFTLSDSMLSSCKFVPTIGQEPQLKALCDLFVMASYILSQYLLYASTLEAASVRVRTGDA